MNTVLSFMDKLYSDSKTLSIVYVVGAVLLFIFIILLMVSLRKTDKKSEQKIIEEPKIDDEPIKESEIIQTEPKVEEKEKIQEEVKEDSLEQSIFEKTTIIPLSETSETNSETDIAKALENVEKEDNVEEKKIVEENTNVKEISVNIPDVDDFVDNVVKKTYEKNEQFSSVYVGNNTSTIKLDKVMENLNVDEKVKDTIVPEEEKSIEVPKVEEVDEIPQEVEKEIEIPEVKETILEEVETPKVQETVTNNTVSLDGLKKALEEKQKEVILKQDDLKAKLETLKKEEPKSNDTLDAEDLLNKLNSLKEK